MCSWVASHPGLPPGRGIALGEAAKGNDSREELDHEPSERDNTLAAAGMSALALKEGPDGTEAPLWALGSTDGVEHERVSEGWLSSRIQE